MVLHLIFFFVPLTGYAPAQENLLTNRKGKKRKSFVGRLFAIQQLESCTIIFLGPSEIKHSAKSVSIHILGAHKPRCGAWTVKLSMLIENNVHSSCAQGFLCPVLLKEIDAFHYSTVQLYRPFKLKRNDQMELDITANSLLD